MILNARGPRRRSAGGPRPSGGAHAGAAWREARCVPAAVTPSPRLNKQQRQRQSGYRRDRVARFAEEGREGVGEEQRADAAATGSEQLQLSAAMALTVQNIRRVLKGVRYFFMVLVFLAFVYFIFTMVSLGSGGTIDVLSEVPVYLSEER